jgi:hypothetical protein
VEPASAPLPGPAGIDEIKDQWRRYGLAEGMRKHSVAAPSDEDRLLERVQELERVVDVHTATLRKLIAHLDSSSSTLDRVAEGFVACPNCETRIAVALRADPPF